jgi:hypothetical protein
MSMDVQGHPAMDVAVERNKQKNEKCPEKAAIPITGYLL